MRTVRKGSYAPGCVAPDRPGDRNLRRTNTRSDYNIHSFYASSTRGLKYDPSSSNAWSISFDRAADSLFKK